MRAVVHLLLAVGVFHLARAQESSEILRLSKAAVAFPGELPCPGWSCDCALRQVGCCCATSRMHEVEDLTYTRLTDIWQSIKQLDRSVQETIGGRRVAFTASGIPSMHCFGPFSIDVSVPYNTVSLNHGDGYNPALGVFTAPRAGLYSFSFTAYSRRASAGDRMFFQLQLLRNGEVMASVWEENRQDSEDSSTQGLLLSLERGGQVYVLLRAGRMLCGDAAGRNTFSGYMVHGM
ncbi:cerebellin-1-like [Gadus morhua]|uniref:cerebellin-1-like n=1 Tax=Gadus morhua TaxID=8049 RepID=UPI0011B6943B|nr:cerebellin-1-like [Gadus morhua]